MDLSLFSISLCAETEPKSRQPNCSCERVRRSSQPAAKLVVNPAPATRVFKPEGCGRCVLLGSVRF